METTGRTWFLAQEPRNPAAPCLTSVSTPLKTPNPMLIPLEPLNTYTLDETPQHRPILGLPIRISLYKPLSLKEAGSLGPGL